MKVNTNKTKVMVSGGRYINLLLIKKQLIK